MSPSYQIKGKHRETVCIFFFFSFIMKTQNHLPHPHTRNSRETVQVDHPRGAYVSFGKTDINYGNNTEYNNTAHHKD